MVVESIYSFNVENEKINKVDIIDKGKIKVKMNLDLDLTYETKKEFLDFLASLKFENAKKFLEKIEMNKDDKIEFVKKLLKHGEESEYEKFFDYLNINELIDELIQTLEIEDLITIFRFTKNRKVLEVVLRNQKRELYSTRIIEAILKTNIDISGLEEEVKHLFDSLTTFGMHDVLEECHKKDLHFKLSGKVKEVFVDFLLKRFYKLKRSRKSFIRKTKDMLIILKFLKEMKIDIVKEVKIANKYFLKYLDKKDKEKNDAIRFYLEYFSEFVNDKIKNKILEVKFNA